MNFGVDRVSGFMGWGLGLGLGEGEDGKSSLEFES